jgi:apolipoprotein N-acyltransferase
MRAVETGRPMLRATNTGMTAVIGADGAIQAILPAFTEGVLRSEVRAHQGMTPYARYGNLVFVLLVCVCVLVSRQPRRR